jgi:SagB-type dehydrogenase family enzyme
VARLRRARSLMAHWRDGDFVIENFVTRIAVSAAPITVQILSLFDDWQGRGALAPQLPEFSRASISRAVRDLVEHTLLVAEGSAAARLDQEVATTWKQWLPHGSFHFATKDAPFANPRQWKRLAQKIKAAAPQPALVKTYPKRKATALPPARTESDEFLRVLLERKTHREFSGESLPLESLATLLRYTWGSIGTLESPNFGTLFHKTSPSGGARHPAEVYVAALDVDGLTPGLYHYNHVDHTLEQLRTGQLRDEVLRLTLGQEHVGNACAVCFMTAVFPRSSYKYHTARAYRVVTLDTGHVGQTFCLVATWLGLAPFTTAALADTDTERALGIDGVNEGILYVAGVGMPKNRPHGGRAPADAGRPPAPARTAGLRRR